MTQHVQINLDIEIKNSTAPTLSQFTKWAEATLKQLNQDSTNTALPHNCEINIIIIDEPASAALNNQFRKKNKPTNVLSFPAAEMPSEEEEAILLGDLAMCAPIIEREATEKQLDHTAYWAHMLIHGTLHLLGYDHQLSDQAKAMEAIEQKIMAELGFHDPYQY